jgi:hypothetical protein
MGHARVCARGERGQRSLFDSLSGASIDVRPRHLTLGRWDAGRDESGGLVASVISYLITQRLDGNYKDGVTVNVNGRDGPIK